MDKVFEVSPTGTPSYGAKTIHRTELGNMVMRGEVDPYSDEQATWNREILQPAQTITTQEGEQ